LRQHDDNNQRRNDDSRTDKNQRNGDKRRRLGDTVATVDRGQHSKKGSQQDNFQKLLAKPCPLHPKARHTILECINLRKSLQEHPLEEDKKKKGKQEEEDNDKDGQMGFQQPANTVNVIYGGDSTFNKRA